MKVIENMQGDMKVPVEVNIGNMTNSNTVAGGKVIESELNDLDLDHLKYGVKVGNVEDYVSSDINGYHSDQTVPLSQFGYVLGVPEHEWADLQASLHGNEDLDIDPHYAFFGCNTESEVMTV